MNYKYFLYESTRIIGIYEDKNEAKRAARIRSPYVTLRMNKEWKEGLLPSSTEGKMVDIWEDSGCVGWEDY